MLFLMLCVMCFCFIFFFKQKTAYEMRISDWSSDVCSSDLWCRSEQVEIERDAARSGFDDVHCDRRALAAAQFRLRRCVAEVIARTEVARGHCVAVDVRQRQPHPRPGLRPARIV